MSVARVSEISVTSAKGFEDAIKEGIGTGVYWRADPGDMSVLDGEDDRRRAELIAERLKHWKSIKNA